MITKKQQGLTSLSWLMVLAIGGVFLTAAFKIGPLYLDNYFIAASLDSLKRENLALMSNSQIRSKMSTTFSLNNVRDIDAKQLKIKRDKKRIVVSFNYEKRVNFMGNLDFVTVFTNEFDSSARE